MNATAYIDAVLSGTIPACQWVRLACQRHVDDLAHGASRGLRFDTEAAEHAVGFFRFLKHSKGEWAGRPLTLEPWQQFYLWTLFGWKRDDDTRRFRTAYQEVARKNGKTTIAAGVGLYLLLADGEAGAEIYTAATKRDQARIAHSEATRMVKSSPFLRQRITAFKDNLHIRDTASKFEPLGRDENSMHGLNVHAAIVDEVHAHPTREVWDVLETATGSRRQPLMFGITTAGYDRQSLCYQLHDYAEKVLAGTVQDDSFHGIIYTLDDPDAWEDEVQWIKANPNLGVSVKLDDLRRKAERAKEIPSSLNAFLRLHMNVWTQSVSKWLDPERWMSCGQPVNADALRGRVCYGGLDLSSTTDLSALALVFPPEQDGEPYQVLMRFWVPEDAMRQRSHRDRVPYDAWVRQGWIAATPGNVIDYEWILAQVDKDAQEFDLHEIAFDRWGATKIIQAIEGRGMTCVQFGQGFASMSAPTKELEKLVLGGGIAHGSNPVLNWMADNVVVRVDPAGNLKPDKERSTEKIDGIVALVMGLDRALRHAKKRSVYEERGVREL